MATTTKRASIWNSTNNQAKTTAAFTPAANDLLIAVVGFSGNDNAPTMSDSQSGAWDLVGTFRSHSTAVTGGLRMYARTTAVAASSMTVTATPQATTCTGGGLAVLSVSGSSGYGAGAIRAEGGLADQAAGTPAPVLPQAALTTSTLIGAVMTNTNGAANCAPPIGWAVEDYDQGYATPATGLEVCHRDTGETNTTITFGAATPSQFGALVIEILPAASTADLTVTLYQGVTAKASKVISPISVSSFTDDSFVLTETEANSITDYNDLRLGFKATATGGARVDVSWAELETPGAPPSSIVPALTVAGVASVPTPTVLATALTAPSSVAGSTTVPAATVSGTTTISAAVVSAVATVPAATVMGSAIATVASFGSYGDPYGEGPGSIPVVATIPTPAVNPIPPPVDEIGRVVLGSSPPHTTELGYRVFTSTDEFGLKIFGLTGAITATPTTVAAVASVPTPTVIVPDALVLPATVAAVATIPASTVLATAIATPATVAAVTSIGAPTVQAAAIATPATVAATASVPAPTLQSSITATPATVAGTATIPAPTAIRGTAVVTPAMVTVTAAVPTPVVIAGGNVLIPATTVAGITTIPAVVVIAGASTLPATVLTTATVGVATVRGTATVSPATAALIASIPVANVFIGLPGEPVRDPQAKLTGVLAEASLTSAEAEAVLTGTEGKATLL